MSLLAMNEVLLVWCGWIVATLLNLAWGNWLLRVVADVAYLVLYLPLRLVLRRSTIPLCHSSNNGFGFSLSLYY
jgi:hypothetical protein